MKIKSVKDDFTHWINNPDVKHILTSFRKIDKNKYPELSNYNIDDIYEDKMGPGGLYLASEMVRSMNLDKKDLVLDLGCGKGTSSIFLQKEFSVKVIAIDLWISSTFLYKKFQSKGIAENIVPLNIDITQQLPFPEEYFDKIFCMNSLSFYGGNINFIQHLLKYLKKGGIICVGSECFNEEFSRNEMKSPPKVFSWEHPSGGNVWDGDFSKQHSPNWWKSLFVETNLLDILELKQIDNSDIFFEDLILYDIEHKIDFDNVKHAFEQVVYGRDNCPFQTLFILTARKR